MTAGQPGLRDLHLGLDGPPEGRGDPAPRRWPTDCSGCRRRSRLTSADRVLQKTPFSFDVSVLEFFWPLMAGAELVMARPGGHRDPEYAARRDREARDHGGALRRRRCCRRSWRRRAWSRRAGRCAASSAAARRCRARCRQRFHARLAGARPAQPLRSDRGDDRRRPGGRARRARRGGRCRSAGRSATRRSTCWTRDLRAGAGRGRRASSTSAAPAWRGATWTAPELTAERFVPEPVRRRAGARLYRTGDLGAVACRTERWSSWAGSTTR